MLSDLCIRDRRVCLQEESRERETEKERAASLTGIAARYHERPLPLYEEEVLILEDNFSCH